MNFITISYGIAALVFLLFSAVLLLGRTAQRLKLRLLLAAVASAVWAALIAFVAAENILTLTFVAEALRDAAWIGFLCEAAQRVIPSTLRRAANMLSWAIVALAVWVLFTTWPHNAAYTLHLYSFSGLGLAFIGLVLLEQLYRNVPVTVQPALRPLVIGLGANFAYDLFLYSQIELLQQVSFTAWAPRGLINACSLPLIVLAVRRNAEWSIDIFISRQAVFYSTALVAVGCYFLLLSIGGYYARLTGGEWGSVAQLIFFLGAGALLLVLLSENLRRRFKVFISKHFYRNKYDYRVEWLRFVTTLSASAEHDIHTTAVRAMMALLDSPAGMLLTRNAAAQCYTARALWPPETQAVAMPSIAYTDSLSRFIQQRLWIVDLQQWRTTPALYADCHIPDVWLQRDWRLLIPLIELDQVVGIMVLAEPPPPFTLIYEDRDLLQTAGRHVATYLTQYEINQKLTEAQQFETFNRLTAFVMHDLKNAVAQLSLVVKNAALHKHNPDFVDDAIETIANATQRIEKLIEQLRQGDAFELQQKVALNEVLAQAAARCKETQPFPAITQTTAAIRVTANAERLTAALEHLIRNAQDATPSTGTVQVTVEQVADHVRVRVTDNGAGMDTAFIQERLFRPFDSTKETSGMGMGAFQAREYVRSIGGHLEVSSSKGQGTDVVVTLPCAE